MRQLGIIVFGASRHPRFAARDRESFASSARAFKALCTNPAFVGEWEFRDLDLYDADVVPSTVTPQIIRFLSSSTAEDLVIYYCGHGHNSFKTRNFSFFLPCTDEATVNTTVLNFSDMMEDLRPYLIGKRVYMILDACYSGGAIDDQPERMDVGTADPLVRQNILNSLPHGSGVLVFSSAGSEQYSIAPMDKPLTLFTGALVDVVTNGVARASQKERLSWQDVCDEVELLTRQRHPRAPTPWLKMRRESERDLSRVEFFRNEAYVPPKPVAAWKREQVYWERIENSTDPGDFEGFVEDFPKTRFRRYALNKVEKLIEAENAPDVLVRFMRQHRNSERFALAEACLMKLEAERIGALDDLDKLRDYVASFQGTLAAEAAKAKIAQLERRNAQWAGIRESNDPCDFEAFLRDFPEGPFSQAARENVVQLIATEATAGTLERFLEEFESSERANLASMRLATIEWSRITHSRDREELGAFAARFKDKLEGEWARARLAALEEESRSWAAIESSADPSDFEAYGAKYPGSPHAAEARTKARELISTEIRLDVLERFEAHHPASELFHAARSRRALLQLAALEWERLQHAGDAAAIRGFLERFGGTPHWIPARHALAEREWLSLRDSSDPEALEEFILQNEGLPIVAAAQERLHAVLCALADEEAWWDRVKATSETGELVAFLRVHRMGRFGPAATQALNELRRKRRAEAISRIIGGWRSVWVTSTRSFSRMSIGWRLAAGGVLGIAAVLFLVRDEVGVLFTLQSTSPEQVQKVTSRGPAREPLPAPSPAAPPPAPAPAKLDQRPAALPVSRERSNVDDSVREFVAPRRPLVPPPAPIMPKPSAQALPDVKPEATPTLRTPQTPLSREQERALRRGDVFEECSQCPAMVVVPADEYTMGPDASSRKDKNAQITARIAKFAVGKFEVTLDQFSAFAADAKYSPEASCHTSEDARLTFRDPGFPQTGTHPVVCVNWIDAKKYVEWLRRKTGREYRLLTEAEWEYAARAGAATRYYFGDTLNCDFAHTGQCGSRATIEVGQKKPNDFGLHDMVGNAFEWTEDCWSETYQEALRSGEAWRPNDSSCDRHSLRGGSWSSGPIASSMRTRNSGKTDGRAYNVGLRVARALAK